MLELLVPIARALHLVGVALAAGSAASVTIMRRSAASEALRADGLSKVELPGLYLALLGGVIMLFAQPVAEQTWFVVKMLLVLIYFGLAHLRAIDARRIVRERAQGAKDDELRSLLDRAPKLDLAALITVLTIIALTSLRFLLFA